MAAPARPGSTKTTCVPGESRDGMGTGSASSSSAAATMSTDCSVPSDLCEYTEKLRRLSTSSPQNSTRTGARAVAGKTSTRPPRTAKSPASSTWSCRV